LNDFGEFIPKITGSGVSSRSQSLYGGTTPTLQTISFDIPQDRNIQKIVFQGASLPSNVVIRDNTNQIIGSSDSFSGESSVTVSNPQPIQSFTIEINRLRVSDGTQRFQNIRISDILIYDSRGYIITPEVYPQQTFSNQNKRVTYEVLTSTRAGYVYQEEDDTSRMTIDQLNGGIYGYRGRFIGARTIQVRYDGIPNHVITLQTPFSNVYSNVFDTAISVSNISFGVLSTFEGFVQSGIGNFNVLNQYYEPLYGTFINGGTTRTLQENEVYIIYTLNPGKRIETLEFETSMPAVCRVNNHYPSYLPFGTYTVFGADVGAFMGRSSILGNGNEHILQIRFPRKTRVLNVSVKIPKDNTTLSQSFTTDIEITIGGETRILDSSIIRESTQVSFNDIKPQDLTTLVIRVKKRTQNDRYLIGLNDIRINSLSLKNYGIEQGSIIEYIPPTKHTFSLNENVTELRVACREYYSDRNKGDGTLTIRNVRAGNLLNGFTSTNVKESYEYNTDAVVGGESWVEIDLGVSRRITTTSYTWDTVSFSRPVRNVLQVYTGNGWVDATLPFNGRKFRQLVESVTEFKNGGRIRLSNWTLDTFPGLMTSNTRTLTDIFEEPSFGTFTNQQLNV
jgi:hypothetical protein